MNQVFLSRSFLKWRVNGSRSRQIWVWLSSLLWFEGLQAQFCDSTVAPTGVYSLYTPGIGADLYWDTVPGSVGVQITTELIGGPILVRLIVGPEINQYAIPDSLLATGTYTWFVQGACTGTPPFGITPASARDTFFVPRRSLCAETVADLDGRVYPVVQIGGPVLSDTARNIWSTARLPGFRGACWMAENLQVTRYRNGDSIPGNLTPESWAAAEDGASTIYKNNPVNLSRYGRLYNAYAVRDSRGVCPEGWHVPALEEWQAVIDFLGGPFLAGGRLKAFGVLSDGSGWWQDPNTGATNESGFAGQPGGNRSPLGEDYFAGLLGYWWTATPAGAQQDWAFRLAYGHDDVGLLPALKSNGFAVRCVED